jgi:hypothetical protein
MSSCGPLLLLLFYSAQVGRIPLGLAFWIEIHSESRATASELCARQPFGTNSNPRPPVGDHRSAGLWPHDITKSLGAERHVFRERRRSPATTCFWRASCPRSGISRKHDGSPEGMVVWCIGLVSFRLQSGKFFTLCQVLRSDCRRFLNKLRSTSSQFLLEDTR